MAIIVTDMNGLFSGSMFNFFRNVQDLPWRCPGLLKMVGSKFPGFAPRFA